MSRLKDTEYPTWICDPCGEDYGTWYKRGSYVGPPHHYATYRQGTCGICGAENVPVTEPRDFGHLGGEWRAAIIKRRKS